MDIFLLVKRSAAVTDDTVFLNQVAEIWCQEEDISKRLQHLPVLWLNGRTRMVISSLYLVKMVEKEVPACNLQVLGEKEVIVELMPPVAQNKCGIVCKIILVSLVTFFGTAFTIMAYHNDIGINRLFQDVYHLFMNRYPDGISVLEIGYSMGLAGGILLFYNHIGSRKLTNDPTPMEVSMQEYESAVNDTLAELAERQGVKQEAMK